MAANMEKRKWQRSRPGYNANTVPNQGWPSFFTPGFGGLPLKDEQFNVHAQAQAFILAATPYAFAQAQAYIKTVDNNAYGQAQASIVYTRWGFGQAQAYITLFNITPRGTGTINASAATSTVTTPSSYPAAGSSFVLVFAYDNSASGGTDPYTSIVDSKGNTWTRRVSELATTGSNANGATLAIFTTEQDVGTLVGGDTVTVNHLACTVKSWAFWEVRNNTGVTVYSPGGTTGLSSNIPSITTPSTIYGNAVIGGVAYEYDEPPATIDTDTTNGIWSPAQSIDSTGAPTTSGMSVTTQFKQIVGAGTQTYNPTFTNASDWAIGYIIFSGPIETQVFGQAQAEIFTNLRYRSGQAQAYVLNFARATQIATEVLLSGDSLARATQIATEVLLKDTNALTRVTQITVEVLRQNVPPQVYGQAQANIKQTYQAYAQAQAEIVLPLFQGFGQSQADIKQTYFEFAQAQSTVLQVYQAYAQAQANIENTYSSFAQAQADILQVYQAYAQAQADILATYQAYANAQADIKQTYNAFAQAQASILAAYQAYAQAQAKMNAFGVQAYAQAQAFIALNGALASAQAQADIKQTYFAFGQAQADTKQTYYGFAQAQSAILQTYQAYAQAQASILRAYNSSGQAQADILTNYLAHANAQADIKATYQGYAQSQGNISQTYRGFAQAQATILQAYRGYAQAQAKINAFGVQAYGQAQANTAVSYKAYAQAQTQIRGTYNSFGQARAYIPGGQGYAQAQAKINVYDLPVFGQAKALIDSPHKPKSAQAQAYIRKDAGYGQAQALIILFKSWAQAQAQIKKIRNSQLAQAQALITKKRGHAQAQARIKQTKSFAFAQARAVIGTKGYAQAQAFINKLRGQGQAQAQIISFKTQAYAQAQTRMFSFPTRHAQAGAIIKLIAQKGYGQSEAAITLLGRRSSGQAQADVLAITSKTGLAMAHILGNTGYGQAQALIDSDISYLLLDTFTRTEFANMGSPDIGPDWAPQWDSLYEPLTIDGSTLVYNNNITSDGDDDYGFISAISEINQYNAEAYLEFKLEQLDIFLEMDLRQTDSGSYAGAYYGGWNETFNLEGSSVVPQPSMPFTPELSVWYSMKIQVINQVIKGKVWKTAEAEPDWQLESSGLTTSVTGGFSFYLDNDGILSNTFNYIDNINVVSRNPFFSAHGQAKAYIINPNVFGQAQAHILGNTGYAQANAYIKVERVQRYAQANALVLPPMKFAQAQAKVFGVNTVKTGQAVARVRFEVSDIDDNNYQLSNYSNNYQDVIMQDYPDAYYALNERFPEGGDYYTSNMLYKDTAWDNIGLYDLTRLYGSIGYGPSGNEVGIPGTDGDTALHFDNSGYGFNYLYRYVQSQPLTGSSDYTIEFWYTPLALPVSSTVIFHIGAQTPLDQGDVSFIQTGNDLQVFFGIGGSVVSGPLATLAINNLYHVVLRNDDDQNMLYVNGVLVDNDFVGLAYNFSSTIFINFVETPGATFRFDELALYNWAIPTASIPVHYFAGLNFSAGIGHANAYIIVPSGQGQAQATIFNPWGHAQARAKITNVDTRKYAQAQAVIKGGMHGQAQAFISRARTGHGTAQAIIRASTRAAFGQAKASINKDGYPTGMAQAFIASQRYLVAYNKYQLPGYAQGESFDSVMNIAQHYAPYQDMSLSEYLGLNNKTISLNMLVTGDTYLDMKNQVEYAGTIVRSNRVGFAPLYIQSHDKHYEALATSIKMDASVSNTHTLGYQLQFEAKPWLISDNATTLNGGGLTVDSLETVGRTLANGTWTPATMEIGGYDVTISGYTATNSFTGFVTISGYVSGLTLDTEHFEATMNGESANYVLNDKDYRMYIGPGITYFAITGAATSVKITYYDRWNL